jgi:hypothetical protein
MAKMRGHIARSTGWKCRCCTGEYPTERCDEKREAQREIEEDTLDGVAQLARAEVS